MKGYQVITCFQFRYFLKINEKNSSRKDNATHPWWCFFFFPQNHLQNVMKTRIYAASPTRHCEKWLKCTITLNPQNNLMWYARPLKALVLQLKKQGLPEVVRACTKLLKCP